VPFRVFASSSRRQVFPPVVVLSWNWSLVQSVAPAAYRPHWFCEPTTPLAEAPVLWVSAANAAGRWFRSPGSYLSASSTFLQSLDRRTLAVSPQQDSTSHELSRPSAHPDRRVHYDRALPARRFRLQGLATLLTVSSSATLADLVSDRQRPWDSPFGVFSSQRAPRHSCRADPHAVSRPPLHGPCGPQTHEQHRLLGFAPVASPSRLGRIVRPGRRRILPWGLPF
jgi:hypothetical protein